MIPFLSFFLNWLGGGVLGKVLDHLETKAKLANDRERLKTEVTISEIKAELADRQERAKIVKAELGHPVAWFPRFVICMAAAIYFVAHVVDAIWQLDGDVAPLPPQMAGLLGVIFGGMFLSDWRRRS